MKAFILSVLSLFISLELSSQSDDIYTDAYLNESNGHGYVGPLSDVFAANLNTQLFPFAKADSSVRFHIGIIGARAVIPSSMKTHTGITQGLNPEQVHDVPTIFGPNESLLVQDAQANIYLFPGGFAINRMTFLVPQVSLSGVAHTDISARFFTWTFDEDFKDLTLVGGAIRHHVSDYLVPGDWIDLSVGYAYHNIDADNGTVVTTSHFAFVQGGISNDRWQCFAQAGYVKSALDIDYTDSETTIDFHTEGTSNFRFGFGASLSVSILNFSVQADFLEPRVVSAYAGFRF